MTEENHRSRPKFVVSIGKDASEDSVYAEGSKQVRGHLSGGHALRFAAHRKLVMAANENADALQGVVSCTPIDIVRIRNAHLLSIRSPCRYKQQTLRFFVR